MVHEDLYIITGASVIVANIINSTNVFKVIYIVSKSWYPDRLLYEQHIAIMGSLTTTIH